MMTPEELMQEALAARKKAHAPYSHFKVGAAVLAKDGSVFVGCNVENAAYGLCNCAERTALFSAVAAGYGREQLERLAVVGASEEPVSPCGACRQVMAELLDQDTQVLLGNLDGKRRSTTVAALLPDAFRLDEKPDSPSGKDAS